jgi:hypothetical protein
LHPSRFRSDQVLAPLLEHNLKRLLVEKYGLVDCDLEHEIDRNLDYHENLDNILGIHGLTDQVIHYEVEREMELIEKQLERRFRVDETGNLEHIESRLLMTNPVRNEMENGVDRIFNYFDMFYGERFTATVNPAGAAREKAKIGSATIEPFDKLCKQFFRKARELLEKWERILSPLTCRPQ